ncbi:MAG TPA: hypothetical protein VGJ66_09175 [Pyrinomonadaceae bacterium]
MARIKFPFLTNGIVRVESVGILTQGSFRKIGLLELDKERGL